MFQAPEVFSTTTDEYYNPVQADIWSYGATLFWLSGRVYPYNVTQPQRDLDADIQRVVAKSRSLSAGAKRWFHGLLAANSVDTRTSFQAIQLDPWFRSA